MNTENDQRRHRWLRYGRPWGLLEKTNPKATLGSVVRHAILWGIVMPLLFGVLMWLGGADASKIQVWMVVFAVLGTFIGGLVEWQGGDDCEPPATHS
ncbi:MAG: hypothetical protein WD847_02015 [Pirellulales bacterium]